MDYCRQHKGLTLIELLVSMTLGVMILAGMTQMLVSMRQTERLQDAMFRLQESGRFALSLLTEDIQQAGYMGCATARLSGTSYSVLSGWDASDSFNISTRTVSSTEEGWSGNESGIPNLPEFNAAAGSDILRLLSIGNPLVSDVSEGRVVSVTTEPQKQLYVTDMDVDAGDLVLVSNCSHALLLTPCDVSEAGNGLLLSLDTDCESGGFTDDDILALADAQVNLVDTLVYYIGFRGDDTNNPPSLFVRLSGNPAHAGTAIEMVEGIAGFEVMYGADSNLDSFVDAYLKADQVTDWSQVLGIRINLLTESLHDNLLVTPETVMFMEHTLTPADRKLRREFSTLITLRNKVL